MKKYIEVIKKRGYTPSNKTQIIEKVTKGYAFNYLIPNGLARIVTKGELKHLKMLQESSSQKRNETDRLSLKTKKEIMQITTIHFKKKCGKNHQIFGSISESDIQDRIWHLTGQRIDKRQIIIDNIKQLGKYSCQIIITENMKASIKIRLIPYSF